MRFKDGKHLTMPLSTDLERWLTGARIDWVLRRDHSWEFAFVGGASMDVAQTWRLLKDGALVATDRDDGQTGDRDGPIDAEEIAQQLLDGRCVLVATVDPETADLRLSFDGGIRLEVLTTSALCEAWNLIGDGVEVAARGGQLSDPAWFLKGSAEAADA